MILSPVAPAMLAFGQTYAWPDGDTITIDQPQRKQTTAEYSGNVAKYIVVNVTVHNAGPEAKRAISYVLDATVNDRSVSGYAVSEFGAQAEGYIAPGGTLHFTNVYQATDPAPVKFGVQAMGEQSDPGRPVIFYQGTV